MKKLLLVLAFAWIVPFSWGAEIYTEIDSSTLMRMMRNEGYSVSLDSDADIVWKKDGIKSYIIFSDGNERCNSIYFRCGFSFDGDKVADAVVQCNEYNSKYRFGKAYVEVKDGKYAVVFQYPFILRGGVTKERIQYFFKECIDFFGDWKKTVVDPL